jgi:hypothetical protein
VNVVESTDTRARASHQALLADYSNCRDDERQSQIAIATMASIAMAYLTAVVALIPDPCPLNEIPREACLSPWIFSLVPLPPFGLIAWVTLQGATATIRSFYLRALERRIEAVAEALPGETLDAKRESLATPSMTRLAMIVWSPRRGITVFRYLQGALLASVSALLLVVIVSALMRIQPIYLRVASMFVYGAGGWLMAQAAAKASLKGRELWEETVRRADEFLMTEEKKDQPKAGRSLLSYALVPRLSDAFAKTWILPAALAVAVFASENPLRFELHTVIAFIFIFELLIYQTRYIWNDVRNCSEDATHPDAELRGHLSPPCTRERIRAGLTILAIRLGVALFAGAALKEGADWALLAWGAAVFVIALPYDYIRDRLRSDTGPPGRASPAKIGVYLLVGLGYALRCALGFWLGGALPSLVVLAALLGYALGIMMVTMTWAIESVAFFLDEDGKAETRRGETLRMKQHLGPLAVMVGLIDKEGREPRSRAAVAFRSTAEPREVSFLRLTETRFTSWGVSFVIAAALSGIVGVALSTSHWSVGELVALYGVSLFFACAVAIDLARRAPLIQVTLCLLSDAVMTFLAAGSNVERPLLVSVPFLVVTVVYMSFLGLTNKQLSWINDFLKSSKLFLGRLQRGSRRTLLGNETTELLDS